MDDVKEKFEHYVEDLHAQLKADSATGGLGEDDRAQLNELIEETRTNITQAEDAQQAETVFARFKKEAERYAGSSV